MSFLLVLIERNSNVRNFLSKTWFGANLKCFRVAFSQRVRSNGLSTIVYDKRSANVPFFFRKYNSFDSVLLSSIFLFKKVGEYRFFNN